MNTVSCRTYYAYEIQIQAMYVAMQGFDLMRSYKIGLRQQAVGDN